MPKYQTMQNTDSAHSIDLSKPEGMSSFWNLFSTNNKKQGLQVANNNEKNKLNGIALKILKLKGIDLENIGSFEKNDFQSLKQNNKVVIINPNQLKLNKKHFAKGNMLFNLLNNQKGSKDFEINVMSSSAVSIKSGTGLIKSSMTYLRPKKPNIYAFTSKKGVQPNEKGDNTFNLLSGSLSESDILKSVPEAKNKKRKKKRVFVPVYVGKKKATKPNNSEEESSLNCDRQDETFDISSLLTKIKAMEEQLNNLECKSKINKPFQFEAATLITNRAETINYTVSESQPIKHSNKNDKENIFSNKLTVNHQQKTTLSEDSPEDGQKKKGVKIKQETENFDDILSNPDILIKNHNLIIPGDLSKESLFQANPCAGCDTILKLFNALSERSNYKNQQQNTVVKLSSENIRRQTSDKKDDYMLSHTGIETNRKGINKANKEKHNDGGIMANFPISSSLRDLGNNRSERNCNGFRNIFSLPLNSLNNLKSFNNERSFEKMKEIFQETTSKPDIHNKSHHNIVKTESVCSDGLKDKPTICDTRAKQSKTSIQNLQTNSSQNTVSNERVEIENDCGSFLEETSMTNNLIKSKSSEGGVNKVKVDLNRNTSNYQLHISSPVQKELSSSCHDISVDTVNGNSEYNMNLIKLNISHEQCKTPGLPNQTKKLFKKTTISCPVKLPDQKVSITILIENNIRDERKIQKDFSSNVKIPSLIHIRDIQSSNSSLDLKEEQNVDEKSFHLAKELCVADSLLNVKTIPSTKSKITYCDTNQNTGTDYEEPNWNDCGKTELFGLTSNNTYLTKEKRKVFDKEVLRVDNFDSQNTSLNLSDFKFKRQYKNPFSNLKYGSGLINILSQTTFDSQEAKARNKSKLNTKHKSNILPESGTYNPRSSFYMESCSTKSQSKSNPTEQNNSFSRNNETKTILHGGYSSDSNKSPSLSNNKNECRNYQQLLKPQINNHLSGQGFIENSDSVYLKKRPCRYNLTLNQESLVRQTENKPPFLKLNEKVHQDEKFKIDKIYQLRNNKRGTNQLNLVSDSSIEELKLFKSYHRNFSPINELVYKTVMCVQQDFTNSDKSKTDSHSCDAELDIPPEKITSNIAESKLGSVIMTGRELESSSNLETQLSSFQYKKVGNNGVQKTYSNYEDELIQQNNIQCIQLVNSEDMLNHPTQLVEHGLKNCDSNSSKGDTKVICQKTVKNVCSHGLKNCDSNTSKGDTKVICQKTLKNVCSQKEFNKTNNNILQSVKVKTEITYSTNEAKSCCCCTSGCLFMLDDFSDEPEE